VKELSENIILDVRNLTKYFSVFEKGIIFKKQAGSIHACDDVSFTVERGKTLGLVGESGGGKTTLAKIILYLLPPTSGEVYFDGKNIMEIFKSKNKKEKLKLRRKMQYIFQDPYSSLNPRMTVADLIMEPFQIHEHVPKKDWPVRMYDLLKLVGLEDYHAERYPHEFSGGQRQRICIARALAVEPEFLIADEPVSSLDVSIRAQILNLLGDLQSKFNLTYIYISHDLSTVRHICDRVAVMYLGRIVELADVDEIFESPRHPYTKALISAVPSAEPGKKSKRVILRGEVPSPIDPPPYCRFYPRCSYHIPVCMKKDPKLEEISEKHFVACFRAREKLD